MFAPSSSKKTRKLASRYRSIRSPSLILHLAFFSSLFLRCQPLGIVSNRILGRLFPLGFGPCEIAYACEIGLYASDMAFRPRFPREYHLCTVPQRVLRILLV
ncbi:unnamed protein product [Periconia digitata]|uniref:Uncharacterized protein n=1 Tax=Periconia digitata TaxID=1303443 RepID=A0A9W4USZ7_9PLEO|nr:unnamed protein product [Periconia digitata]